MNLHGVVLAAAPGWIALNKPCGIPSHATSQDEIDATSLAREVLHLDEELRRATGFQDTMTPQPVHRLDRETSGVLLLALGQDWTRTLQTAFQNHVCKKTYRAVLRGSLAADEGRWTFAISDKAEGRQNPAGKAQDRKASESVFYIRRRNRYLSEIEIDLLSGRQHQIRKHASLAGHAIVGDARYGDPRYNKLMQQKLGISRLLLHASRLVVPLQNDTIEIEAPLPDEFQQAFQGPT